jgi:Skp family chaperone for outer membrane proteins
MNYVEEYNKTRGYDAILLREAGVYFNPALDITDEIVAGLNARYTAASKK